jgi:hypothetical protein
MRELSGLSHEEIALALETSVGAAKQAIYEARRSLFEFAEGRAMPCDEIRRTISDADGRLLRSRRVRAHLRECSACATFAAAIPERRGELRALVPTLPAATAAGLLGHVAGTGSAHGSGSGLVGLAVGGTGKAAGAALAANALAGVAVVATATVGVTIGVDKLAHAARQAGNGQHAVPAAHSAVTPARTPGHAVAPAARAIKRQTGSGPLRASSSTTLGTSAPSRANPRAPSPAAPAPGASTGATAAVESNGNGVVVSPGHSGAAPGHSSFTSTAPGHSGAPPGHSTSTGHGHSSAAPGHSSATAHGHSSAASGHSSGASAGSSRSAAAPGHTGTDASVVTVPSAPPLPSLPVDTVHGNSGARESVPPGQLK